jgi:hypothetical protein
MPSQINPNSIDPNYPIAGENQSTAGFRSNFLAIQNQFIETEAELNDLTNKVLVSAALTYGPAGAPNLGVALPARVGMTSIGVTGDTAGQLRYDLSYLYVCTANFDGNTHIWYRIPTSSF